VKKMLCKTVLAGLLLVGPGGAVETRGDDPAARPLHDRDSILPVALETPEARALYRLRDGVYESCIVPGVTRPCDSDWVTCIDDAWVVRFEWAEACGAGDDGRRNLVLLMDAADGRVISRYPEAPYFQQQDYCQADRDCEGVVRDRGGEGCYNFVHAGLDEARDPGVLCVCRDSRCRPA
jgi:hypothetical protein